MATKINKETTEIAVRPEVSGMLASLPSANDMLQGLSSPETLDLFPAFKYVFPVELKPGSPFKANMINTMVITDGKTAETVEAPYILTTIAVRNASRELVTMSEGKEFIRAYGKMSFDGREYGNTDELYKEYLAKAKAKIPNFDEGITAVVAVIKENNNVALCEMPLFRTIHGYWHTKLVNALLVMGIGCRVDITDHANNQVMSANNQAYPSGSKFKQVSFQELTKKQVTAVLEALKASELKFQAWLER